MRLWYAGAEVPAWRTLLAQQGVTDVAMSFVGLTRKIKKLGEWNAAEHFPGQHVLLDSGGFSLNNSPVPMEAARLHELTAQYEQFVARNVEAFDYVIELDALALGPAALRAHRDTLHGLAGEKLVTVWHPEEGVAELMLLVQRWGNVALGVTHLEGRDLTPILSAVTRDGAKLFGMAMTKPDVMRTVPLYSVHSTSWLSPSQYGDTVIWSRGELHRYHQRQKDNARRRHRSDIEAAGFDPDLIAADDRAEVLRLSIWSWQQQLAAINRVTKRPEPANGQNAENDPATPAHSPSETDDERVTQPDGRRPRIPLPGIATELVDHVTKDPESGAREVTQIPVLRSTGGTSRTCDNCYIRDVCTYMQPGADCVFDVSVTLSTAAQIDALLQLLIEHEARDYLLEDYEAQVTGGGDRTRAAAARSRLARLIKLRTDLNAAGFTIHVSGRGALSDSPAPGIISRLFGEVPAIAPAPPPVPVYEQLGVEDAVWVTDEPSN